MHAPILMEEATIDITPFVTAVSKIVTPTQVLTGLAALVGVAGGFFVMWLLTRKAVKVFSRAASKGKISL